MRIRFACPLDCASKQPYQPTVVMFFGIAINISAPHNFKRHRALFNAVLWVVQDGVQFIYLPVLNRVHNYKSP